MAEPTELTRPPWQGWLLVGLVVVLVGTAFGVRVDRGHLVVGEESIMFRDNDTARRLVRLQNLVDADKPYPYQNPLDGYPEGSVIHWTLPMDWVIRSLDPLVSWAYPQARRFEAGAIWADCVLGALSVLAFVLLSMRWLGPWLGVLAAALYGFSFPAVHITLYGIGDHQALQHFLSVVALLGFICLLARRVAERMAFLVGGSLGLALWVSTESSIVLYTVMLGAFVHLLLVDPGERRRAAYLHLKWTGACFVVAFIGDRFEHPGSLFTFEWDLVSGFWLYQILVFAGFLGLLTLGLVGIGNRPWAPPLVAAGASVGASMLVLVLTGLHASLGEQMELFSHANRWTQNAVVEYRAMFMGFGRFFPLLGVYQLSWLILAIPIWFVGCALNRSSQLLQRAPVLAMALGLFGFACMEMKVSHLFVILYPWVLITGGAWCVERFGEWMEIGARPRRLLGCALGLGAVVVLFFGLPPRQEGLAPQLEVRELAEKLKELQEDNGDDEMRSVLAYWHWGAKLMYYGDAPMVATGYHRNLAGIEDSYRVLVSRSWEECEPILRARKVRWILSVAGFDFLHEIPKVLPSMPQFMTMNNIRMNPGGGVAYNFTITEIAQTTLHYFMTTWHPGLEGDPHYQLVYEGGNRKQERDRQGALYMQPRYRIWRVVYPGEAR